MEFSVDSAALMTSLKRLSSIVTNKPMIPMHEAIKIGSRVGDRVSFFACNPHMSAQAEVSSENVCSFEVGVNAEVFTGVVAVLPKDTKTVFTMDPADRRTLVVTAGKASFRLNLLAEDVFSPAKNYEEMPFIPMDVRQFIDNLKRVSFCRNSKSDREIFSAVCVNTDHFVSTDGYRLSFVPNKLLKVPGNLIVSGETADRLQKLFDKTSGTGKFFSTLGEVSLSMGGITVTSRLMVDRFPAYQSVIPSTPDYLKCVIGRLPLLEALSRATAISSAAATKQVEVVFLPDTVRLLSMDASSGAAADEVAADVAGAPGSILLNGTYLVEALRRYDSEKVAFEMRGDSSPFVITDGEHVNVIQPIRRGAV